jgi:hypothetical protein
MWVLAQRLDGGIMGLRLDEEVGDVGIIEHHDTLRVDPLLPEEGAPRSTRACSLACAHEAQAVMKSACCCSVSSALSVSSAAPLRMARNLPIFG